MWRSFSFSKAVMADEHCVPLRDYLERMLDEREKAAERALNLRFGETKSFQERTEERLERLEEARFWAIGALAALVFVLGIVLKVLGK
jgi:hypothetical protein